MITPRGRCTRESRDATTWSAARARDSKPINIILIFIAVTTSLTCDTHARAHTHTLPPSVMTVRGVRMGYVIRQRMRAGNHHYTSIIYIFMCVCVCVCVCVCCAYGNVFVVLN